MGYSAFLGDRILFADEEEYLTLARNLIEEGTYTAFTQPTAFRPPGYPYLLSVFVALGFHPIILRFLNYLVLGTAALLLSRFIRKQGSPLAAYVGLITVLFNPVFFYTAGTLYPQTLISAFLVLVVTTAFSEPFKMRHAVLLGMFFGCLLLLTPATAIALVCFAVWAVLYWKRESIQRIAVLLGVCLLVITPWTVRNTIRFDSVVFISTNGGFNLLMGNNPKATATTGVVDISEILDGMRDLDEIDRDAACRREAVDYILDHPARSVKHFFLKFLNYFHFRNTAGSGTDVNFAGWKSVLTLLTYGPLLLFALFFRLALSRRFPLTPVEGFILILYLLNGAFTALFFTRIRFRVPFDILLVCVASLFLARLMEAPGERPQYGKSS
jgi:hypothetical protein